MDQEQLNEFEENIRSINQILSQQAQMQAAVLQQMRQQMDADRKQTSTTQDQNKATQENIKVTKEQNVAQAANVKGTKEYTEAMRRLESATASAGSALGSLAAAALDTDRNFKKYGGALDGAGDAALELGKSFGGVGTAAGALVKAVTLLAGKQLEQADNLVTATDTVRKLGGAGAFTSEEFLNLAHNAGVTSKNLDLLVKPLQGLGPTLMGLGNAAGDGIKRFAELTEVTEDQRMQFRRMGIDQEQLIESQAAYLELQNATGRRMQDNVRSTDQLQKASLEYTRNLSELAALTGKDVDALKKEQQAAMAREEFMIQNAQTEREIAKLREQGRYEEAEALEKELNTRDKFVTEISTRIGDATLDTAIMQMITSGGAVFTEETAALARSLGMAGEDFNRFLEGIQEGDEGIIDEFLETFKKAQDATVDNLGRAAILGGESVRKAFLLSGETMTFAARRAGEDEEEARLSTQERIKRAMEKGFDPTMDARASLTELEIDAGVAMDRLVAATNPLIGEMNVLKGAVVSLTIAAGAAAAALMGVAGARTLGALRGGLGRAGTAAGGAGAAGRVGQAAGNLARTTGRALGTTAGRIGIGAGAGVIAGGIGAYQAVGEGRERGRDISMREESGQISEEQASAARRANVAQTTGEASGTMGGAVLGGIGGAKVGASIGAMLGPAAPIGILIGGLVGSAVGAGLGAWAGGQAGEAFGKSVGELIGESITLEDVSGEITNLQNEILLAEMEGKSEEEIVALKERLQLTERLQQSIEAGDHSTAVLIRNQLDLMEAQESGNQELIEQKEKLVDLDSERYFAQAKLEESKRHLQLLEDNDATEEQLAAARAVVEANEKQLEQKKDQVITQRELYDLENKVKELQEAGLGDSEASTALQEQADTRRELLEASEKELDLQERILQEKERIATQEQLGNEGRAEERRQILAGLEAELEANNKIIEDAQRKVELEREIADLEKEKEEAGIIGRFFRSREIAEKQRELEELSQPSAVSEQEGTPSAQTETQADADGQDGGEEAGSSGLSPDMEKVARDLESTKDTLHDFAERMGLDASEGLEGKMVGGVPVEINGQQVPDELYTEEQRKNISAAQQAAQAMPGGERGGGGTPSSLDQARTEMGNMQEAIGSQARQDSRSQARAELLEDSSGDSKAGGERPTASDTRSVESHHNVPDVRHTFRRADFAERDPENYEKFEAFQKSEFERIFEILKENMPPGFRNKRSLVREERKKADILATKSAVLEFEEAIEAAGAGTVEVYGAAKGGVFSGPQTGFPVELHGTELVAPLDPNSILMELAQTSADSSEASGGPESGESTKEILEQSMEINTEMMQMLSAKLDTMISALETGNEVSDRILKQTY